MPRPKLQIGSTCKGKYGPHQLQIEADLEDGKCKACKRAACTAFRNSIPDYNTKAGRAYRKKRLKKNPHWDAERRAKEKARDPYAYVARHMLCSLRRSDKLQGRETSSEVTVETVTEELRRRIGKPCIASISCGGATLQLVPKNKVGSPSLDHVDPAQQITMPNNLRVICFDCNFSKSDLTLKQARATVAYLEKEIPWLEQQQGRC